MTVSPEYPPALGLPGQTLPPELERGTKLQILGLSPARSPQSPEWAQQPRPGLPEPRVLRPSGSTPSTAPSCPPHSSAHPLSAIRLTASAQSGAQRPPRRTSTPFPGCPSTGRGWGQAGGGWPRPPGAYRGLAAHKEGCGRGRGSIFNQGLEAPNSLPRCPPCRGQGGGLQGVRAWAQGPHHPQAAPGSAHSPPPFSPTWLFGKKKRNFLACWDLPPTPLCKDKLKVVGASKFSLQSKELGPKRGQDLLKSLTNQRLSTPLPPATPTTGTKARLEPAPEPWVILGRSGLSPGLGVPGVIDTRTGRAQPLTHPTPRTCQQDIRPGDRHAGGHPGLPSSPTGG